MFQQQEAKGSVLGSINYQLYGYRQVSQLSRSLICTLEILHLYTVVQEVTEIMLVSQLSSWKLHWDHQQFSVRSTLKFAKQM